MISNVKNLSNIRQLCQLGLIDNIKKIAYAQIVMQNPDQGVKSMVYRDLAIEIFNKLINFTINDQIVYRRVIQLLSTEHHKNNLSEKAFQNLVSKSAKSGLELSEIIEVFNEGYNRDYPEHQTKEQRGFNHLNHFLAMRGKEQRETANKPSAALRALQEASRDRDNDGNR